MKLILQREKYDPPIEEWLVFFIFKTLINEEFEFKENPNLEVTDHNTHTLLFNPERRKK